MSRQLGLDSICLRPTSRWGHTEYSMGYHPDYVRKVTGLASDHPELWRRFHDRWAFDFHWGTNDGLYGNWSERGRATDMGHAVYAGDGSDQRAPAVSPFLNEEEVWAFDAVAEYGLPDFDEQVTAYQTSIDSARAANPDQVVTGGYYKTIVSGAIQAFGWEMLLVGASDAARMEKVWDSFYRRTRHHMDAWARTDVEVIIQHDDFVWTEGAFMDPEVYRKVIIPHYAELWKPLHAAGKRVIFCSDGNFMEFAQDIVEAGADGLCFEPCNEWGLMVERFGKTHCLIGSDVDCRDMAFHSWDTVRRQVDRTLELAQDCRGLILAVGNHIPANVPDEMLDRYIEYLMANWGR